MLKLKLQKQQDRYDQWFSDCIFGAEYLPQSQCEKGSFFPNSMREGGCGIPNSVVIKLFVEILNEIKSRTFSSLWPGYCLFWLCKRNTMHKIPGTSSVYWDAWFVESGVYQRNESGKCSIWNKFYIKDVYWNKLNIKIVNMSCDLRCLIFYQFIGN